MKMRSNEAGSETKAEGERYTAGGMGSVPMTMTPEMEKLLKLAGWDIAKVTAVAQDLDALERASGDYQQAWQAQADARPRLRAGQPPLPLT